MNLIINTLSQRQGSYTGNGINHDNDPFKGELNLKSIVSGKGLEVSFNASGDDGTIFHEEKTIIAPTETGVALWTLNNNVPYMYAHSFKEVPAIEGANHTFLFQHNDPNDKSSFREEIFIDLWPDGDISYRYSWGLPDGEYKERSGLRMKKEG